MSSKTEETEIENVVEHVLGCSKCFQDIIKKAKETFKYECSECGLPLPNDMITIPSREDTPPCPLCGGTGAREIEREEQTEEQEVKENA